MELVAEAADATAEVQYDTIRYELVRERENMHTIYQHINLFVALESQCTTSQLLFQLSAGLIAFINLYPQELNGLNTRGYTSTHMQRCEICSGSLYSHNRSVGASAGASARGVGATAAALSGAYLFPCSHGYHADCLLTAAVHSRAQVLEEHQVRYAMRRDESPSNPG
jgi:hypothetical protein